LLIVAAVAGALGPAASAARAEVRRYALLIGSNKGAPHEPALRYAEADVHAVAQALTDLAGFPSERIVRVTGADAARVRGQLLDLNLTIQQDARAGVEAVLFVYYSGHADAQTLHLGGSELPTDELSKLVRTSNAKLKILLVDACRAGTLTRVKGGRQVAPFQIGVEAELRNEGYAIITSSAAGEDAQESDALRSSIFTYHFLAALRGLGDVNGDRLVTLLEAYGYAYEQALKTSITTVVGAQHANFHYDLRGRNDPVLADLRARGERAELVLGAAGEYLFLAPDTGAIVLEAAARAARTPVLLPPGRYSVRLRTRTSVFQTDIALRPGESRALAAGEMRPVPLAQVVRKGETDLRLASGPVVAGMLHGPLERGFSPMLGATVGWAFELPRLTLLPRVSAGTSRSVRLPETGTVKSHDLRELALELGALYAFDFGRVSVAPLVSVGWALLDQRITSTRAEGTTTARPQGLLTTLGAHAVLALGRGFTLEVGAELANFYFPRSGRTEPGAGNGAADDPVPTTRISGTLTYRASLGVGYRY
jgi:uncharacterized caspase-like protein